MTINIDKLRQALGAVQPEEVEELLDRLEAAEKAWKINDQTIYDLTEKVIPNIREKLEAAEKERNDAKAAAENIALKLDYLRSKLETAENAQNDWLRANAPGGWIDNLRIENEALRAEIIHIKEVEFPRKAQAVADGWRGKCERLEAKVAEMEKQEPVAWGAFYFGGKLNGKLYSQCDTEAQIDMYIADRHQSDDSNTFRKAPLYALPGAKGEEK